MFKSKRKNRSPEDEKIFLMWSGVSFFMILILSLWVFNMKHVFSQVDIEQQGDSLDINTLTENFDNSMEQIRQRLEEVSPTAEELEADDLNKN